MKKTFKILSFVSIVIGFQILIGNHSYLAKGVVLTIITTLSWLVGYYEGKEDKKDQQHLDEFDRVNTMNIKIVKRKL